MPIALTSPYRARFIRATALLLSAWILVGCDPSVDVLRPSDTYRYSVFGVLDVAADTQAFRVEALDDSVQVGAPADFEGTVLLENLDAGSSTTLRDSFAVVGSTGDRFHNFWTTRSVTADTRYRLAVQEGGRTVTSVTTKTPSRPPELTRDTTFYLPCLPPAPDGGPRPGNTFILTASGVDRIAAVQVTYPVAVSIPGEGDRVRRATFNYTSTLRKVQGNTFEVPIAYRSALTSLNPDPPPSGPTCISRSEFTRQRATARIATAGPGWPDWRSVPLDQIARPDSFTNVRNGLGFVGSIYSNTIQVPLQSRP
ncbi:hypothetical protein GGP66_002880 [Salinibacter ruber]|nr:hypothetical protein [Salinibacter ruber]